MKASLTDSTRSQEYGKSAIETMSDDAASDAASQRAAEQARLRKERREAKLRAGGSARLNRITGLGGGLQRGMLSRATQLSR